MPKTDKAQRTDAFWNPLACHGKKVEKIAVFGYGHEIAEHHSGWLVEQGTGSNNADLTVFDNILFENKRKVDLHHTKSFMVGNKLYIHTNDLPYFEDLGEQVASQWEGQTNYGYYIEFHSGDKRDATVRPMKFMMGCYTRIEKSEREQKIEALDKFLKDAGVDVSLYGTKKLVKVKDELIAKLQEIK